MCFWMIRHDQIEIFNILNGYKRQRVRKSGGFKCLQDFIQWIDLMTGLDEERYFLYHL